MFHVLHYVFENRIGNVTHEEVALRVPIWEEGAKIRVISYHKAPFVVLVTPSRVSWFRLPTVDIRGFRYQSQGSWFWLPTGFVVLSTFFRGFSDFESWF